MKEIIAMIKFYGGCVEKISLFDDEEKLAVAFAETTGISYASY